MIRLLYFMYAIIKQKVKSLSSYSIFVLTKVFSQKVWKFSSFWISFQYGAHRYGILFMLGYGWYYWKVHVRL